MKLSCIVVDDEHLAIKGIESYIDQIDFLDLKDSFSNPQRAFQYLKKNEIDLLLLDINMPGTSGLELASSLPQTSIIIFTTAYRDFALESYELGGLDYLVKPYSFERFYSAVLKAQLYFEGRSSSNHNSTQEVWSDHFYVKVDKKIKRIKFENITFIQSYKDYVFINDNAGNKTLVLISMKKAEGLLPTDLFLRVHRSYLVAKDKIDIIEGNRIYIGENKIPIGEGYRELFQNQILKNNLWTRL